MTIPQVLNQRLLTCMKLNLTVQSSQLVSSFQDGHSRDLRRQLDPPGMVHLHTEAVPLHEVHHQTDTAVHQGAEEDLAVVEEMPMVTTTDRQQDPDIHSHVHHHRYDGEGHHPTPAPHQEHLPEEEAHQLGTRREDGDDHLVPVVTVATVAAGAGLQADLEAEIDIEGGGSQPKSQRGFTLPSSAKDQSAIPSVGMMSKAEQEDESQAFPTREFVTIVFKRDGHARASHFQRPANPEACAHSS
jgi:hypothetical protein